MTGIDDEERQRLWTAAYQYALDQDAQTGDWPSQRTAKMPDPPWPSTENPMLKALLSDFRALIVEHGVDAAMLQLATHCWFEGGIDGYNRGQRDARAMGRG